MPTLVFLPDQDAEVAFCAEIIAKSLKTGNRAAYSDWAILYRTNAQSLGFETELLRRRIPYRVVGSLKFYEREEVKDALALLSFLVNPRDEVAFRRVVNKPSRGVGAATVDRVVGEASLGSPADGDLAAAARRIMPLLSAKARSGLASFLAAIDAGASTLLPDTAAAPSAGGDAGPEEKPGTKRGSSRNRESLSAGEGLSVCIVRLILEAGIAEYHISHDEIAGNQRIANLQELANAASLYPATRMGLLEFLEHIELDRSMENTGEDGASDNVVTLITLHNTKGLEFRRVIMTGVEQGVFPREDKRDDDLEEERRLFYVGVTRAMDDLYLTSCAMRRMFGRTMPAQPSIFLREAGSSSLRVIGDIPHGFASPGQAVSPGTARRGSVPDKKGAVSSDGRWRVGDRVYHDDHGYGGVMEIRESEDGPVIRVRYETGHETRFLSSHQSSQFIKIGDD
jgi:DNA helicase-2/ATP-dependent DNA helicase PcrA